MTFLGEHAQMNVFLVFLIQAQLPRAANTNTTLEGWQFDDNSRSTWTIVWMCFSTILACTWTVLRVDVPSHSWSNSQRTAIKVIVWLMAVLCPEVVAWGTVVEMFAAKSIASSCNSVQKPEGRDREPKEGTQAHDVPQWTIAQGYCVKMGGLVLQTQDYWVYKVTQRNILAFIRAGIIDSSDFRDEDIEDRSKADALGMVFTIIQSAWAMCNIIARAAYSLPISPLELGTIAYVACGILTYAFWWHKPKDMTTPISIPLRYDRDDIPVAVRSVMDTSPQSWYHLRGLPSPEAVKSSIGKDSSGRFTFFFGDGPARFPSHDGNSAIRISHGRKALTAVFATFIAFVFSGIHVAG
jgi:hypothetical protein